MAKKTKKSNKKENKGKLKPQETEGVLGKELIEFDFKKIDKSYWVTAGIVLAIVAMFLLAWFFMKTSTEFQYRGIYFDKTPMGSIIFYTATIPVIDSQGNIVREATIDFRTDPRTLEDVPVDLSETAGFVKDRKTYVSTRSDIPTCDGDTGIALINQGIFLRMMGLNIKGAYDDPDYKNSTTPYVNCETDPQATVIMVKAGNETKIEQTTQNCYELTFKYENKTCEVLKVTEKFQLTILEQYMGQFQKA